MRYVVVGAGAIGGTIGGELARAGHEVTLVARGDHLRALREQGGLALSTPDGAALVSVPAVPLEELALRPDDVLVLAVKLQDAAAALRELAARPVADGSPASRRPVVCAQNGVAGERMALRAFRRVYGCYVRLPATHLRPGAVIAEGTPRRGILDLGRYPAGADATVEAIAADLSDSSFSAVVRPDVLAWKYHKLLDNLGNAVDVVLGPAPEVSRAARAEAEAVLAAAGVSVADDAEVTARAEGWVRIGRIEGHERVGSSSRQSVLRGTGTVEADYLNGEIALLGRLHDVPTPVNEALVQWANVFARERRAPGTLDPAELAATVETLRSGP